MEQTTAYWRKLKKIRKVDFEIEKVEFGLEEVKFFLMIYEYDLKILNIYI